MLDRPLCKRLGHENHFAKTLSYWTASLQEACSGESSGLFANGCHIKQYSLQGHPGSLREDVPEFQFSLQMIFLLQSDSVEKG